MTFIDFFSGIGGFHSGFEKAGIKCVGWCEFDKFVQKSYRAMYDTERLWFSDDVRKARGWELPKADIWSFGFPCQDISVAGKQKGIRGTRSGLFFEIMRLLDESEDSKPKWLVCENVKNLLSIDRGRGMLTVLSEMAERGYDAEWRVYNSKNYGVPQNRERVYIVGYLRGKRAEEVLPVARKNTATLKQVIGGSQGVRVYDVRGVSCTLSANGGGMGAKTGLYMPIPKKNNTTIKVVGKLPKGGQCGIVYSENGNVGCLCATQYKGPSKILSKTGIRKLTPKECWRLQGFTDEQFDKAQAVNSDTQLYKQAGNAVTVNVAYEIGKHIAKKGEVK